ncbi:hypothetical protein BD779DRAFT_1477062 [Infundibulicybe gibba]|nr:hypothetical protein BD779DRAFT_1477062 [Infundibulicybe gibba]
MFSSLLIFIVAFSQGVHCIPAPVPLSCANGALARSAHSAALEVGSSSRRQSGTLIDTAEDLAIDAGGNDDAGVVEEATGGVANVFEDDQPRLATAVEDAGKTSGELTRPVGNELEKDL